MNGFRISLPASSANIGPGFDSAGIALNRYLTLHVEESEKWEIKQHSHLLPDFQNYQDNFIYQIAEQTAKRYHQLLPSCTVTVDSEIPLARGLGSSASAVMAGIELANQLCGLSLTNDEKLGFGTEIEGHPDNVAAVLFGGFVITAKIAKRTEYIQLPVLGKMDVVVYIPTVELKTEDARNVLPVHFSREHATNASGISNVMIASLLTGDYRLAGKMMEQDLFHEPYRAELIPFYYKIRDFAKQYGAYGTVISGAGPTMISFVPKGEGTKISNHMQALLPDYQVDTLTIDSEGLQVIYNSQSKETVE